MQDEIECTLWIKTTQAREADVRRVIAKLHPYELPEILVINVSDVHPPYYAWLKRETTPASETRSENLPVPDATPVTPKVSK